MANEKKISKTHTAGLSLECIIRRDADGALLDDSDGSFGEAPADHVLALTEDAIISGLYEAVEDRTVWADGKYTIIYYVSGNPDPISSEEKFIIADQWESIPITGIPETPGSAYCTQNDIINLEMELKELIALTDDSDSGNVNTTQVTAAIAKAGADIDAYCQDFYTVPFSTVPAVVVGWAATLSAFNLYRNRAKPTTLVDRYNKVMNWLASIRDGKAQIPGVTEENLSLPASTTDGTAQTFRKTQTDIGGNLAGDVGTMDTW